MDPLELLTRWGVALVFGAVLVEQAGLPLPAAPVVLSAGALAADGTLAPELVLLVAVAACFLADHAWFVAGRFRGRALLAGLCRISISPDTCVRRTDDLISRHGPALLMVAKFVPGVAAVSIPTAAAMGLPYRRFVFYDVIGCFAWAGAYTGLGMIFSREITALLDAVADFGSTAIAAVALAFSAYIGFKVAHRRRLARLYRLVRIAPPEFAAMLASGGDPPLLLDTRTRMAREDDPRSIPGSMIVEDAGSMDLGALAPRDRTIVTFCTCPNEASAAYLADRLIKAGYERVRVLTGGSEALEVLGS